MKNKYYFLIALVAVVIIVESLMLLLKDKEGSGVVSEKSNVVPTIEDTAVKAESDVSFTWREGDKVTLLITANREISLDALDLYIDYSGVGIKTVDSNGGVLPSPTFKRISPEKSLVVLNYLIDNPEGLKLSKGQSVEVLTLGILPKKGENCELKVDAKTQVVENGSSKVLPFNSQDLIIKSSL